MLNLSTPPSGYRMIDSIEIKRFKGLRNVRLDHASRINVIIGPNGTGKTALLEAAYLGAGHSPDALVKARRWRGREGSFSGRPEDLYSEIFGAAFGEESDGLLSEISLKSNRGEHRKLQVTPSGTAEEIINNTGELLPFTREIEFSWYLNDKLVGSVVPTVDTSGNVKITKSNVTAMSAHFMALRFNLPVHETAQFFSRMRIEGTSKEFEETLLEEFDFLSSVSVQAPYGALEIYGQMKSGKQKLLPLSEISSGVSHLAGIIARLSAQRQSIMLIDEIENGFYYDRYKSIWRALHRICKTNENQVFATSHSIECLQALAEALSETPDDVMFYRARLIDGESVFTPLSARTVFPALEIGEVR